uniref:Uncharacterized protein n=1 Tax=Chenopodium quinoa TaxID=63459 RepID=A0A803MT15_CHEQI
MENVRQKVRGFSNIVVECEEEGRKRRGGLAMLWKSVVVLNMKSFFANHTDVGIDDKVIGAWSFTGIYGHPEEENKFKTGLLMEELYEDKVTPWLCGGDFNLILIACEKKGGDNFKVHELSICVKQLTNVALLIWVLLGSFVTHLTKRRSDHIPLILCVKGCPRKSKNNKKTKLFRFKSMWLCDEKNSEVLEKAWKSNDDVKVNLARATNEFNV